MDVKPGASCNMAQRTYSAEGVLECLSGMPFDVEFISFDDVKKGIPKDIRVIINVGDAYTSFSGAENWIDEAVVTTLRQFVDEGGGFIGVGEPTAYQHQGRFFQLADVLGVDREMGFSLSTENITRKIRSILSWKILKGILISEKVRPAFMRREIIIRFLQWMENTASWLLINTEKVTVLLCRIAVFPSELPYSASCNLLCSGMEQEMKRYYVTNVDTEVTVFQKTQKIAVINNSGKECQTDLYINAILS